MKIGGMIGLVQVSALTLLEGKMIRSIDEALAVYRQLLVELGGLYARTLNAQRKELKGLNLTNVPPLKDPLSWNLRERYDYVIKEAELAGAERLLRLSDKEIDEGRRGQDLPERRRALQDSTPPKQEELVGA